MVVFLNCCLQSYFYFFYRQIILSFLYLDFCDLPANSAIFASDMKFKVFRTIVLCLSLISWSLCVDAQRRIEVRDSVTGEPIPYASVYFGNRSGSYTDVDGVVEIPADASEMRLSHISYETKSLAVASSEDDVVRMAPTSVTLSELSVDGKAPKRISTESVGNMKAKTHTVHKGANGFEMALFIPYDSTWTEPPYIHSILASLDYSTRWFVFREIEKPVYATLRFDLRLPDAVTGAPCAESLIGGGILKEAGERVDKKGVSLVRPVPFPTTGVFVVVEWITTARVSESESLVPSLGMTLDGTGGTTWNKKTFMGMDWMMEQDEPIYSDGYTQELYKGRTPSAKLGLAISRKK